MSVLTITSFASRLAWWQWVWAFVAAISLPPVCYHAYRALQSVEQESRVQLIQRYSLWESDPNAGGDPQKWTRFAARLLNTGQLMRRVREKHGDLVAKIEEDYSRELARAQGKVVAVYLLSWGVPLALLYGAGWIYQRRNPRATAPPPSNSDKTSRRKEHIDSGRYLDSRDTRQQVGAGAPPALSPPAGEAPEPRNDAARKVK